MSILERFRTRNRLPKYLVPTGALALVVGGYLLWEYGRQSPLADSTSTQEEPSATPSGGPGQEDEFPTYNREGKGLGEGEDVVRVEEDPLLPPGYEWNEYRAMSTRVKAIVEAALLGDILSRLGATLSEGEASRLLSDDPELRRVLLACWERGSFETLRCHDTIVKLVNSTLVCQNENPTPRVDTEREGSRPARNDQEDIASITRKSLQIWPRDEACGKEEEEEKFNGSAAIQRGNSGDDTTTLQPTQMENATPQAGASVGQAFANIRGQGYQGAISDRPKNHEGVEIYGGNFKSVAGDNWEIIYASDHHRKVAKWYSATDYRLTHHDISAKRAENTGIWLLTSERFTKWRMDPNCRVLWCPGIPGVGKTTIASLVIDYLRQQRSETVAVGFAYFNYKLQGQQNATTVLECLARQLYESYQGNGASSNLEVFHEASRSDHPRPPTNGLLAALSKTCQQFRQYYIVLDALDEYLENFNIEDICKLLTTLVSLGNTTKLLVTSRFLEGLERLFREFGASREEIIADDEDMTTYVKSRIGTAGFRFDISDALSNEIVEKVKGAAGGRFLMAELHMNTLAEQLNRGSLKESLVKLPKGIDATYERVLQRFKTYPESHRELAMTTLTFVTRSKRRLSVRELQHALATKPGLENIEDYVTSMPTITSLCAGLVIVRDETVIFVHFTAQDFFDNNYIQCQYFPGAEEAIFRTCLVYLSLPPCIRFYQRPRLDRRQNRPNAVIPFYDYASQHLGLHAQTEEASRDLDLFLTSGTVAVHQCCVHILASLNRDNSDHPLTTTGSPVFLAIHYSRISTLKQMLSSLKEVPLATKRTTPLIFAARMGRTTCLEAMLGWHTAHPRVPASSSLGPGAQLEGPAPIGRINSRDAEGWTALMHACGQGDEAAVALLLSDDGINVNLADNNGRTPLSLAAANGHEAVVALLLNQQVIDVNSAESDESTPLIWAALRGHEAVVAALLNHKRINVNLAESDGWSPLIWAAHEGNEAVVTHLLNHKHININLADGTGRTPLSHAAELGYEAVVALLLNCSSIDVNSAESDDGWTPLTWAARGGHKGVVALLLNHEGINGDLMDSNGWTPLMHAVEYANEAIMALLLNHRGRNTNVVMGDRGRTILWYAVKSGHETIVATLLNQEGINVNPVEAGEWTPLTWAAQGGDEAMVALLLNHKAIDVNFRDGNGRTPLSHAAGLGHVAVVGLLLKHDRIDVNLADSCGWTPLVWAAQTGHETVPKLLVNHKDIDLDLVDKNGRTLLCRAIGACWDNTVAALLNCEAIDVNYADNDGWTPLFFAACQGREAVTKQLVCHPSIQLNSRDKKGATALIRTIVKSWKGENKRPDGPNLSTIVLLLLQTDLDVNLADNKGHTPLFYARRNLALHPGWWSVCSLLRVRRARLDWVDFIHDSMFPQLFLSPRFPSD